jgi:hypothetical protein
LLPHAPDFGEQLVERHVKRIRDHARGLLEAEASVVVSAAHALEDIQIFFLRIHKSPVIRLEML